MVIFLIDFKVHMNVICIVKFKIILDHIKWLHKSLWFS